MKSLGIFEIRGKRIGLWQAEGLEDLHQNHAFLAEHAAEREDIEKLITEVLPKNEVFRKCVIASLRIGNSMETIFGFPCFRCEPEAWEMKYAVEQSSDLIPDHDPVQSGKWGPEFFYATYVPEGAA